MIVFIELGTRRLLWANCTANPDSQWVTQQARNVVYELQEQELALRFAIHDRDDKFTASFDAVLAAEGIEVSKTPIGRLGRTRIASGQLVLPAESFSIS